VEEAKKRDHNKIAVSSTTSPQWIISARVADLDAQGREGVQLLERFVEDKKNAGVIC
jgi:hypothetical protein